MELLLITLGALAVSAVAGAVVGVARDGYSRVPTRGPGTGESAMRWH
jgi:hypothetical protein